MARPRKEFSVRVNGDSLQCWISGEYAGSVSAAWLCRFVAEHRAARAEYAEEERRRGAFQKVRDLLNRGG